VTRFKASLLSLIQTLKLSKLQYIRCIKPNDTMAPFVYSGAKVGSEDESEMEIR
jgi:myosin heavy subunit